MNGFDKIKAYCENIGIRFFCDEEMKKHVSFKIGGKVPLFIVPESVEELSQLLPLVSENTPFFIFGKGSNLLIDDEGINAIAIMLGNDFSDYEIKDDMIICEAGMSLTRLCTIAYENGLSGLEFAYGIPGTVGGAAYMNAGAYGGEMKDVIVYCEHLDYDGKLHTINNDELSFSYRHSFYTGKQLCITKIAVKLSPCQPEKIKARMDELINRRRDKQPLEYPSAGSTFKRPEGAFAAQLIEECGLKGLSIGGAMVSKKHSGFIINFNNATCKDVLSLIRKVKEVVKDKTGYNLECEIMQIKSDGNIALSVAAD